MGLKDKELLLKDLCARLSYGVMCNIGLKYPLQLQRIFVDRIDGILLDFYEDGNDYQVYLSEAKPYLRPMSSMTEEEKKEFESIWDNGFGKALDAQISNFDDCVVRNLEIIASSNAIDWLNKKMFDYRTEDEGKTMIEKGLALEAPEGMYD